MNKNLTSLCIIGCDMYVGSLPDSISNLTTLRSLSIDKIYDGLKTGIFLHQISRSLAQLTSLELSRVSVIKAEDVALLSALPQLQQLKLNSLLPASDLSKPLGPLPITVMQITMDEEGTEADVSNWLLRSAGNLQEVGYCKSPAYIDLIAAPSLVPLQQALKLRDLSIDLVTAQHDRGGGSDSANQAGFGELWVG